MLISAKNDLETYNKRIADVNFELNEKMKKFTNNESKLSEPVPPPEVLSRMEGKLNQLRATISELENRLQSERDPTKEDKLFIFRQQAALVEKKKDELYEEIESLSEERTTTEMQIETKRKQLVR